MQKVSRAFIDELQKTVNIVDFMEKEYDADFIFSKSSDWANTRCPMPNHDDGNPSFGVNQTNNTYNCFGCNCSGDMVKLVQDVEGLNFIEAIEKLSKFAGIDVETTNLDMKYLLNELTSNINQKLTKENTSNYPGSLSEIGFLFPFNHLGRLLYMNCTLSTMPLAVSCLVAIHNIVLSLLNIIVCRAKPAANVDIPN